MAAQVLVVDGDRFFARSLRTQIESFGVTVEHQLTGAEALDSVYCQRPRVVLIDVDLGSGLDGFGTAASILGYADVPVIYMTRAELPPAVRDALLARGALVLQKPCSKDHLMGALERAGIVSSE
jgi:CheY-like chemotaxis protein